MTLQRRPSWCRLPTPTGGRIFALATAMVLLLLASPTAFAHARHVGDPVVSSLAPLPVVQLKPGSTFPERFAVKNIGHGRATASTVGFYLSPTATVGPFAPLPVLETIFTALKPGRGFRSTVTVTVAGSRPAGSYFLVACVLGRRRQGPHRQRQGCSAAPGLIIVTESGGGVHHPIDDHVPGSNPVPPTIPPYEEPTTAEPGVTELAPVLYTAIDGHTETLTPWQGEHVTVLVEPGVTRDPTVMAKMVGAFDRAWEYYAATTGQLPAEMHSLNGRDEIAEVTSTCGAGCTYLGATGTEIQTTYFEIGYDAITEKEQYDQVPFYELGRSFWFYSPQLEFHSPDIDPVVTGFAVWMRFRSMTAARVNGAPFNGTPFTTFASQVQELASVYEANPSLTFAGTLAQAKSPGMYGGTDFWASLMTQLAQHHGGQTFVERFFRHVHELPVASSTTEAVTNWVNDASYAACTDLAPVFYERWGFPRPDGTVAPRPAASTIPELEGHC
jgi:hypothetical protein